jgi:2-C-methyl-D-erythritol 4-phosphate cytidylyltransferase
MQISLILLAGGKGERLGGEAPKQFLHLGEKPIIFHCLEIFLQIEEIKEIVVVCAPEFRPLLKPFPVKFALPGSQRQDSFFSGFREINRDAEWVMTHDAARPFVTTDLVRKLLAVASHTSAASLALPVKNTLKEIGHNQKVLRTIDRSVIWEIQTPQIIKKKIVKEGFNLIHTQKVSVTDDVSLAELAGYPVTLVTGSGQNIKITTPEDLFFAEWLVNTKCFSPTTEHATTAGKFSPMASPFKG